MAAETSEGPRDLLRRFCLDETPKASTLDGDSPEPKLTLSLSLGGCFGAEPAESQRLFRSTSSSTATLSMLFPGEQELLPPIGRTCSLPTEEDQRKRREMQSLKRLEAKRKRSEKRRYVLTPAKEECVDEPPTGVQAKPAPISFLGFPAPNFEVKLEALGPMPTLVGSHGSGSSNVSDFEPQPLPPQEVKSSSSNHGSPKATTLVPENPVRPSKKACGRSDDPREAEKSMMEEMPCVSTTGNGPNGRRIEGFLYKYRKGEEVRIVCVCHGSFLTPAEFVKHAGGGDVSHPLRHIVVSPSPSLFS